MNFNLDKTPYQGLRKTITKKYYDSPGILISPKNNMTPEGTISPSNLNENNSFENKLNKYKHLFNLEKFNELENLMDEDTFDDECIEIKSICLYYSMY